MCGISGILNLSNPPSRQILEKINRTLVHRGPDDEGYFLCGPVGLAHRRLSIIDLASGQQPMATKDGRYTIVFNGEIYNFLELRAQMEMEGAVFHTRSDTEVLLELFVRKGKDCLTLLNGMFAFAIWDEQEKRLTLARDRMGKKPVYYWIDSKEFVFASEVKAIAAHPQFSKKIDRQALNHYFQYENVPAPFCIFEGVHKLPAAHYMEICNGKTSIHRYWEIPLQSDFSMTDESQIISDLQNLLQKAVERRLISDVPLGVFLSGGIDSSSLVAFMARLREGKNIKTFSIGFDEKSFDESSYAQLIAKKFGTDHHQEYLSPGKMLEILPEVVWVLDEPFADYSIIPTYLLSKFTRQHVTMALGGDGSDELFAGYPTFSAGKMANYCRWMPKVLQKICVGMTHSLLPVNFRDYSTDFIIKQFLYGAFHPAVLRNQIWLGAQHAGEQAGLLTPDFAPQSDLLDLIRKELGHCPSKKHMDRMLYFYQKFYLSDDILVKTDRASMAASLEVRAPYLDRDLVEYVSKIPHTLKLRGRETKYILKKSLQGLLPDEILYRSKKGFGIPIAQWLCNQLRDNMLSTLDPKKLAADGIFNPDTVGRLIQEHLSKKKNNRKVLFSLLMFSWWKEKWME